jgi:hypothetical protein
MRLSFSMYSPATHFGLLWHLRGDGYSRPLHCAISASPITKRSSLMPANGAIIFRTWSTSSRSSRSSMKSAAGPVSIGSTS